MNSKQNKKANKQSNTNTQQPTAKSELLNRTEQLPEPETAKAPQEANTVTVSQNAAVKPYVNYAERDFNRKLPVEKVLEKLKRWMPAQHALAEVVGKWIWITFPEPPIERVRAELSQLGFHWNNSRKCWQHPCGETLPRGTEEPRAKYDTWFPAAAASLRKAKAIAAQAAGAANKFEQAAA